MQTSQLAISDSIDTPGAHPYACAGQTRWYTMTSDRAMRRLAAVLALDIVG